MTSSSSTDRASLLTYLVFAFVAISSFTSTTALPTYEPETKLSASSVQPLDIPADDGDYTWMSYTEKMALGVFGRIPGLEGEHLDTLMWAMLTKVIIVLAL